jgi:hypothetical protein
MLTGSAVSASIEPLQGGVSKGTFSGSQHENVQKITYSEAIQIVCHFGGFCHSGFQLCSYSHMYPS